MKLQLYENCKASGRQFRMVGLDEVYDIIRGMSLQEATEAYRNCRAVGATAESAALKRSRFPALMPACICSEEGRRKEFVNRVTYLCHADFDHLPKDRIDDLRHRLQTIPEVLMAYVSMSGEGFHVYYRWQADLPPDGLSKTERLANEQTLYQEAFRQGNEYLGDLLSARFDEGLAPIVHLSSLCHDANVYYNPDARPLKVDRVGKPKERWMPARQQMDAESLCRLAHEWRERSDSFTTGNRHNYLCRLLFLMSDLGIPADDAVMYLEMHFSDYREERFPMLVRSCYRYVAASFGCRKPMVRVGGVGSQKSQSETATKTGGHITKAEMASDYIGRQKLQFDVLSRKIIIADNDGNRELTDRDINTMLLDCNREYGSNIPLQVFRAMLMSNIVPEYNPLTAYLDSLSPWTHDQPDYIHQTASMVHVADGMQGLFEDAFRKWFVAMVASWMMPKVVNHQVLVLIGRQGIYKTTWLDALIPPQLERYRSKQSGSDHLDKDEMLRSAEFGLINFDEIDRMGERELNALKSLITATDVNVRAAYGYGKERRVRIASYVASGNKEQFLTDLTGNRRWLPFRVGSIDSPYDNPLPYEGMYSQAVALIHSGFHYWFDLDDIVDMEQHVDRFMVETNEEQLIPVYFEPAAVNQPGAMFITLAELSSKLITRGNIRHPMELRRLGAVMSRLGYQSMRKGHAKVRGYIVKEKTQMDIDKMHDPKDR